MKIGYFINHFPFLDDGISAPHGYHCGGAENAAYYLALEMAKRGHDITVYTTSPTSEFSLEEHDSMKVYRYGTNLKIGTSNISWAQFRAPVDQSFDLVHTHFDLAPGPLAGLRAARNAHLPLIVTYHGDWVDTYGGIVRRLGVTINNKFLVDNILNYATHIISPSKMYIEKSQYLKLYKDKAITIPNGVNIGDFCVPESKDRCRKKLGLPIDGNIILFLGYLAPYKGPDVLLRALPIVLAEVPDTMLVFAGKGVMRQDLENLARQLGVEKNVLFVGYVEDDLKSPYYKSADIFALPSVMGTECFPLTILESMACGTPVVASEIGGIPDAVIDGRSGLLVPPRDHESLATAIIDILNNERKREDMSVYGKKRIETYSWKDIAKRTEDLYWMTVI